MPKSRPFRYEWVDLVRIDPTLPAICFKVAHHIASRFNEQEGCAWPSVEDIGTNVSMSTRNVQRAIKKLEKRGFIKIDRTGGRSRTNRYYLALPGASATSEKDDKCVAKGRQNRSQKGDGAVRQYTKDIYKINDPAAPRCEVFAVKRKNFPQRGKYEIEIAERLGRDGWNIINSLPEVTVDKLCRLQQRDRLSEKMLFELTRASESEPTQQKAFERKDEQEIQP